MINRRTFSKLLGVGTSATAASLGGRQGLPAASAAAHDGSATPTMPTVAPGTHTSFDSLKQVRAGLLDVGYAEAGPAHGPVVICLHGWPYDIHSFVDVAPLLGSEGYRVIVPYLRGHGSTRFVSARTFRNAQQAVFALDIVALMDALKIEKAVLAGFDWGARTAAIVAVLWPRRCNALVSVGGYLITDREANLRPLAPKVEYAWWYQYYFATERGRLAMQDRTKRHELTRLVWDTVSPTWPFDDATFERTAAAFENPDYADIVIHNYRWRLSLAEGERRYDGIDKRLAAQPVIEVPTITLDADRDPFTAPGNGAAYRDRFTGAYDHRTLTSIGHNLPQEAPAAFAQAVVDADRL
ncbi:pimeloyl-ACP methyl ester carboxylesterase [Streptomyces griseochromogenes]|uniref:Alpha/beta hydrolase n=1 Tax=Streptomyces griseochromogenes TaxID=68214 RepID=A0A1B1AY38_9ACTN|nr:alpha/beta hydrolase [Streptomyces griseochromogenes]ANP51494.1 alpha/beta hydrolase [Streptomyces griseochromogenes]MBP2049741.1 pimeloyl-ACP methyl ester carboxylesterase [Streptomyces griseochromogenes]